MNLLLVTSGSRRRGDGTTNAIATAVVSPCIGRQDSVRLRLGQPPIGRGVNKKFGMRHLCDLGGFDLNPLLACFDSPIHRSNNSTLHLFPEIS